MENKFKEKIRPSKESKSKIIQQLYSFYNHFFKIIIYLFSVHWKKNKNNLQTIKSVLFKIFFVFTISNSGLKITVNIM